MSIDNQVDLLWDHLTEKVLQGSVYEPAEDTFLFIDSLKEEQDFLRSLQPSICIEIGSGSGCVISYLAKILGNNSFYIALDINKKATEVTTLTACRNNVRIEPIITDLLSNLTPRLNGKVDVLLFNPPYVPTDEEEFNDTIRKTKQLNPESLIQAAWAGGKNGREVLDRLLPYIGEVMSTNGCFYIVAVQENNPKEICEILKKQNFTWKVIGKRKAFNEMLYILRFQKQ